MKYLYTVTEQNVDGCGGDATEYVSSSRALCKDEQQVLKECLDNAKQAAADNGEDLDTGNMVQNALDEFEQKTSIALHIDNSAIDAHLYF